MPGFSPDTRHPNAPHKESSAPRSGMRQPLGGPARDEMLPLVVNLHDERLKAVLVSPIDDGDVAQAWLPRRLIKMETHTSMGPHGVTVRIELPRWLAEEKQLVAVAGAGQGVLL